MVEHVTNSNKKIMWIIICSLFFAGLVIIFTLVFQTTGMPSTFDSNCFGHGGELGYIQHAKTQQEICVKGNEVIARN